MPAFSHYARVVVNPARGLEFIRVMQKVAEDSRRETGCLGFVLLKSAHETQTYCISSIWQSQMAWVAHTATEQFGDQEIFMNGTGILSVVYTEEYYVMESV